jgi:hypothetical protein
LYTTEKSPWGTIANANVNCDEKATLYFDQRPHGRDKRPLEYPIRLCFPHGERGEDIIWPKVPLVMDNRLAKRAHVMPFKQMLTIEPLSDDELPQSTNEDYEPNAGDKYSQLGVSATVAVLDGTVQAMIGVKTFALIYLRPTTGDWARSVLRMMPGFGKNCCYYCAFGAADEIQWTHHCVREMAQDLFLDGSLKLAGLDPLPSEMERGPKFELPPPALQICGFKDGRVTEPAKYHKLEKADHMAESFEMVR